MSECYNLGLINNKYIIIEQLGEGGYSTVYKVKDEKNKLYAIKVVERYCKDEQKINQKLSEINSNYIIRLIDFSQGPIKINYKEDYKSYFLFELADKGDLYKYINCGKNGFNEIHSKLIFYDILKAVQAIHNLKICHRDIKAENILLDSDNYNIKLCDFGFSSDSSELLHGRPLGTKNYMAPEIIMEKDYDGIKADIFSLGVLLLNIRTNKFLFEQAKIGNNVNSTVYDYIKNKDEKIWEKSKIAGIKGLHEDFKELFLSMVAFNPKERPSIEQILTSEWMKEVNNLSEDVRVKKREELINEFKSREQQIILSMGQ